MDYTWHPLWTDLLLYSLILVSILFYYRIKNRYMFKISLQKIKYNKIVIFTCFILIIYAGICILDSIHLKVNNQKTRLYNNSIISILDIILYPIGIDFEKSYTKPFAKYTNTQLKHSADTNTLLRSNKTSHMSGNIKLIVIKSFAKTIVFFAIFTFIYTIYLTISSNKKMSYIYKQLYYSSDYHIMRYALSLLFIFSFILLVVYELALIFHICGTDKIGHDIFYQSIKSVRTSVLIGVFTLAIMLPISIILGIFSGYLGGFVDDLIQYIYTTISSIPGVLLIAASILSLQVFISNHSDSFRYLLERSDLRLLSLCLILGCTGWTSLCRIIRAETLKIRELEFINAAVSLGVPKLRLILKHILPNVQHLILITLVLDFSGLILAEAVLSYVGVGVSPTTMSWGNMINSARLELARDPIVWWPILSAFIFMFTLVFSVNILADQIRDIIDPKHALDT